MKRAPFVNPSLLGEVAILAFLLSACSAAKPVPTIDPEGPVVRVRVHNFEMTPPAKGEALVIEASALPVVSGRVCAVFAEVGGQRMNCLTDEDLQQLMKATAWRETLGEGCDQATGQNCAGDFREIGFDLLVRGTLSQVDGEMILDISVLGVDPPSRLASKRIRTRDLDTLLGDVEQASREFAWIILGGS